MDAPYEYAGNAYFDKSTRSTARRLRRTRQNLGTYRHGLLVGMRVVNSVEREMLSAEWENWLLDESARCAQVHSMLQESRERGEGAATKGEPLQQTGEPDERMLRRWQAEYCGSCRRDKERLFPTGKGQLYR